MVSHRLITPLIVAATLLPLGSLQAGDGLQPRDGLLLLRNGSVLQGRVWRVGQRYFVASETGEIQVPVEQAERFCLDMNEAYRFKRAATDPNSAEDRCGLAAWCLQHRLTRQAAAELFAADQLRPNHPTTRRLYEQLQQSLRPPLKPAAPAKVNSSRPTAAQLAETIKGLPRGALESFTHYVQPLLLNRCASCHGRSGAGNFQVRRLQRGRPLDHRVTQANLYAVLQFVDREKPELSKLLTLASQPHGGSQKAPLADRKQSQYRRLAGWVYGVARADLSGSVASKPKTVAQASGPLLQVIDRPENVPLAKATQSIKKPERDQGASASPGTPPTAESRSGRVAASSFVPRDPFDPEIFNRRYFSRPAQASPRRAVSGKSAKADRQIRIGVARRPSSR